MPNELMISLKLLILFTLSLRVIYKFLTSIRYDVINRDYIIKNKVIRKSIWKIRRYFLKMYKFTLLHNYPNT